MFEQQDKKKESIINRKREPNRTGIPDAIKERAEAKAGFPLDHIRVHHNSDMPAKVGALAYAQGNNIYLGTGQEQHLGHELGHAVQQMQDRVPVTGSVRGIPLNDNPALEAEADRFL